RHRDVRTRAFSPQRVNANRCLVIGVLAPIDEHLSNAEIFCHVCDNFIRMPFFQYLGYGARKGLRCVIRDGGIKRNVKLNALRSEERRVGKDSSSALGSGAVM